MGRRVGGEVPDHEDLRVPGRLQGRLDLERLPRAGLERAQALDVETPLHSGRPDHGADRHHPPIGQLDLAVADLLDPGVEKHVDAQVPQLPECGVAQWSLEDLQQGRARLQQQDLRRAQVQLLEIPTQHLGDELRECAGAFDAGGTAAHDREGQQLLSGLLVRRPVRGFEPRDDPVSQQQHVLQVLHRERSLGDGLVTEIGGGAAARQDQVVVAQGPAVGPHRLPLEVHGLDLPEPELGIADPAEDAPHRVRDVRAVHGRGGHLVEQGREQVVVVPVDNDGPHRRAGQRFRAVEARKAGADDHDRRSLCL